MCACIRAGSGQPLRTESATSSAMIYSVSTFFQQLEQCRCRADCRHGLRVPHGRCGDYASSSEKGGTTPSSSGKIGRTHCV